MQSQRSGRDPDLLIVDADVFFDDVFDRGARGLIEALAEACFRFGFDAKLRREYEQFDRRMPLNALVTLVRARLYAKGVKARKALKWAIAERDAGRKEGHETNIRLRDTLRLLSAAEKSKPLKGSHRSSGIR